eukprot:TRINITY_DN2833_c0_g2_i2.p2 TRINITY_DN2833_c0_g2~~TRINITY_DN2833_c0_g2_i2.p2  ORF type:complete len:125 (+),score=48.17 TRINITY_DN2833_c0_g2_i2:343-717(+)
MFDEDGTGEVNIEELQKFMESMGDTPSTQQVKEYFELMDTDKDQSISFDEFAASLSELYLPKKQAVKKEFDEAAYEELYEKMGAEEDKKTSSSLQPRSSASLGGQSTRNQRYSAYEDDDDLDGT